ncbi:MAG TPA: NYN domain-containing protein [Rhizomicrobium sp.]|nr:NYN domain-containing protein [Rhizomicrobium sp.]
MLISGGMGLRAYVYVDGFNLYYGAVKGTPYRWLNPVALVRQLVPTKYSIDRLKYFTARVSGASDPSAPVRQKLYLDALGTVPEIEIHYGRFLAKTIWRPIVNFPVAGATINSPVATSLPDGTHIVTGGSLAAPSSLVVGTYPPRGGRRRKSSAAPLPDALVSEVHAMEEKGSDVNLAAHLLNDAWKGVFDEAVVLSNDTDLCEPIRMVAVERNLPVLVICPGRWPMAKDLQRVATFKAHIRAPMLARAQFPNPIPGTTIHKPATW